MNKIMAIGSVAAMLAAVNAFGQGQISAINDANSLVTASDSAAAVWGVATGTATPKGATGGLQGQVYYSATQTGVFAPAGTPQAMSGLSNGRFNWGVVDLAGVPASGDVWFQVRVWETKFGVNYDAALNAGPIDGRSAIAGVSSVFKVGLVGPPAPPAGMVGSLASFSVSVVPEPSTLALGALGLAGLFLIRRRS